MVKILHAPKYLALILKRVKYRLTNVAPLVVAHHILQLAHGQLQLMHVLLLRTPLAKLDLRAGD